MLRADESDFDARLALAGQCREKFMREPYAVARRLEIAGYEPAAAAVSDHAKNVNQFSLIEVSWDPDDSYAAEIDVESTHDRVLEELDRARKAEASLRPNDAELKALIDAADLADSLAWIADDYLLYLEGWSPAGYDMNESDDERMEQARKEHDDLPCANVIRDCDERSGLDRVARELSRLREITSAVVHLSSSAYPSAQSESPRTVTRGDTPEAVEEIDTEKARDEIDAAHQNVINAIIETRIKIS